MQMNRRSSQRRATMGLLSSMWDGKFYCIGVIEDVSSTGMQISQIPYHFDEYSQECFSVVHTPDQDIRVLLRPSWRKESKKEMYQLVGFKIVTPVEEWKRFVDETLENMGLCR